MGAVNKEFPTLPFSLSNLPLEERDARIGVLEAVRVAGARPSASRQPGLTPLSPPPPPAG